MVITTLGLGEGPQRKMNHVSTSALTVGKQQQGPMSSANGQIKERANSRLTRGTARQSRHSAFFILPSFLHAQDDFNIPPPPPIFQKASSGHGIKNNFLLITARSPSGPHWKVPGVSLRAAECVAWVRPGGEREAREGGTEEGRRSAFGELKVTVCSQPPRGLATTWAEI
ncbi:unnamed protein product [Boreogadus saida]